MSEYQYFEFRAIDRPLDKREMAALRDITSRAEITPTSLTNVYHWGDFKGDPDKLMDQYFDAHLYLANWGTHRLMLRLPTHSFPFADARPYVVPHALEARSTKTHVVFDFHSESEGEDDFDDGKGWLASLIPLRTELMAGDLRCLYLGWLSGVQLGEVELDALEPTVPPGLGRLSAPLTQFVSFLRIDTNLIEVAAKTSTKLVQTDQSEKALAPWVASLPAEEKDRLLVRLIQGESVALTGELLRRFRTATDRISEAAGTSGRRTAGELLAARERLATEQQRRSAEKAAKEQARRDQEEAAARKRHLDSLIGHEDSLWRTIEGEIARKQPKGYDRTVELLKDLRDLARRSNTEENWTRQVRELRQRHRTKPSLIERLDRAELPR